MRMTAGFARPCCWRRPSPATGVNFAVRSRARHARRVCLYDATGERETARLTLPGRTGAVHHGFVPSGSWRASARCTASACTAPTIRARVTASTPTNCWSIRVRATSWATFKWHRRSRLRRARMPRACGPSLADSAPCDAALPRDRRRVRLGRRPIAGGARGATRSSTSCTSRASRNCTRTCRRSWRGKYLGARGARRSSST